MNRSYKITLIAVAVSCALIIILSIPGGQEPGTSPTSPTDESAARTPNQLSTDDATVLGQSPDLNDRVSRLLGRTDTDGGQTGETAEPTPAEPAATSSPVVTLGRDPGTTDATARPIAPPVAAVTTNGPSTPATGLESGALPPRRADSAATETGAKPLTETPAEAGLTTATITRPSPKKYVIKGGDTFSSIAADQFGSDRYWVDLAQANPRLDPTKLRIGQVIKLPTIEQVTAAKSPVIEPPGATVPYVVRTGDTLSSIARNYYRDPNLWRVIYNINRSRIGPNPNRLRAGVKIIIPPAPVPAR